MVGRGGGSSERKVRARVIVKRCRGVEVEEVGKGEKGLGGMTSEIATEEKRRRRGGGGKRKRVEKERKGS